MRVDTTSMHIPQCSFTNGSQLYNCTTANVPRWGRWMNPTAPAGAIERGPHTPVPMNTSTMSPPSPPARRYQSWDYYLVGPASSSAIPARLGTVMRNRHPGHDTNSSTHNVRAPTPQAQTTRSCGMNVDTTSKDHTSRYCKHVFARDTGHQHMVNVMNAQCF